MPQKEPKILQVIFCYFGRCVKTDVIFRKRMRIPAKTNLLSNIR